MNQDRLEPIDVLGQVSSQSSLMIARYRYAEGRMGIAELGIPDIDKQIASLALLCVINRRSAGILYPFPESDFSILPLLGSLAHLLVGKPGYFVLVSRSCDWKDVYERIRKGPSAERDEALRFLHPFGTVRMDGRIVSYASSRDSTRKTNIVFCRASSASPLVWNDDIKGIVIDSGPPRAKIDSRRVAEMLDLAESHNVPCVVIFSNLHSAVRTILEEKKLDILFLKPAEEKRESGEGTSAIQSERLGERDFVESYGTWSQKIRTSDGSPKIEIIEIDGSNNLSRSLFELNGQLQSLLASADMGTAGAMEQSLFAYASFLESRVRTLWTRRIDYDQAALQSYFGETMENASTRFSSLSRQLYAGNAKVATKAISFSDQFSHVLEALSASNTTKSMQVEYLIRNSDASKNLVFLNYGRIPQKALSDFSAFLDQGGAPLTIATVADLSLMPVADGIILPGYPLYTNCSLLSSSTAKRIIVLCYPWEIPMLRKRVENFGDSLTVLESRTFEILDELRSGNRSKGRTTRREPVRGDRIGEVERAHSRGMRIAGLESSFTYRDLVDFLEIGDRPESEVLVGRTAGEKEYIDSGHEAKWILTTDQGKLIVNESRKLTVVFHTYSEHLPPGKIGVGDVIMVGKDFNPRPMSEYVWDIMAMKGLTKEGVLWREWRRRLKEFVEKHPEEDSKSVLEKLREFGCHDIETPQAVYVWLNADDMIGPQTKDTLMSLCRLLGASDAECELWWASILQVRSTLHSAYSHMWKLVKYYASHLAAGDSEDVLVSPELDIWLSDLADLMSFARVISQPQHMQELG